MTRLIITRHGETDWNVGEVFRGRIDVALNDSGLAQAEALGLHLADLDVEAVYSSPLKRAFDTARAVAVYHDLEVSIAPDLVDFNYGSWQGMSHNDVREKYADLYHKWLTAPHTVTMPDGESLDETTERARKAVDDIVAGHEGTVVLVSHRVINKVLICSLLDLDNSHFWKIEQDTCAINMVKVKDGDFIVSLVNDTCHLTDAET